MHKDLTNRAYTNWREFLEHTDNWDAEHIVAYQTDILQRLVKYAYEYTNGYRELYATVGVHPSDIRTLDDIRLLPFVDKQMIQGNLSAFTVTTDAEYVTTGGSTGIPFGFYRDKVAFAQVLAARAHQYSHMGWEEGDRQIVLRGLYIDTPDHIQYVPEFEELRCSSYHLLPDYMEIYRQRAVEYKPKWLRCYPSSGYLFAKFLNKTGGAFPPLSGVLCASENLYEWQRVYMQRVFRTRVFSHYGQYEQVALAGFCEYAPTYHVLPQHAYVELLDKENNPVRPNQTGEIVGTSFTMAATPFIRYRTQDYATLQGDSCPHCGRPYQVWSRVDGRLQEFIQASDGRLVSMTALNFHNDIFDDIKQFQFHQIQPGIVTFCYVPKNTFDPATMLQHLQIKLQGFEIQLQPVETIPLTPRGKHRFLRQELSLGIGDT